MLARNETNGARPAPKLILDPYPMRRLPVDEDWMDTRDAAAALGIEIGSLHVSGIPHISRSVNGKRGCQGVGSLYARDLIACIVEIRKVGGRKCGLPSAIRIALALKAGRIVWPQP